MSDELPLFGDGDAACATPRPRQLALPLGWSRVERHILLGASLDEVAPLLLDAARELPRATLMTGPARSGRSLIGAAVAARGASVIDDIEGVGDEALFHAWNDALQHQTPLLLIAREGFDIATRALPDLRTRLASATRVAIGAPDPCEIRARIDDAAARVGVPLAEMVPGYVAARLERSHEAIAAAADAIAAHMQHGGSPTLPAIRTLLTQARLIDRGALAA